MTNHELIQKILEEIEAYSIPPAPEGNPLFTAIYTAQETTKMRILSIVQGIKKEIS
jgi:hypothetical protein